MYNSSKDETTRRLLLLQKIKNYQEEQLQATSNTVPSRLQPLHNVTEDLFSESSQSIHDAAETWTKSAPEPDIAQSRTKSTVVQALSGTTPKVTLASSGNVTKVVQENKKNTEPGRNGFHQDKIKITRGKVNRNFIENSALSIDYSPDTKLDLVRRSKLQEDLYKSICEKNKRSPNASNNSSSSFSDRTLSKKNSRDGEVLDWSSSSTSYSESNFRKHNSSHNGSRGSNRSVSNSDFSQRSSCRFYDDQSVGIPTKDLLHLKKPLIDEKNHDVYYKNHGRMDPMDWSLVNCDAEKTENKVSKSKSVTTPGENLLEPTLEFLNAVENSIDDTVYKVSDNINPKNKIDKYSPLLKIERMINRNGPKTFNVTSDDKKRFKCSKRKNHLIDETNLANRNQSENERKSGPNKYDESKCSDQKLENSETKGEVEISDALSPSTKNYDISNDDNRKPKASTCKDESMFQFDKPKSHVDKNKGPDHLNGAKSKPHVDYSKKSSCSQNGSRQKPHDCNNKNPSALDGQKQKSHSYFDSIKKLDYSKKYMNCSFSAKPEVALDSDDELSVTNDTFSLSLLFKFEALEKKLSNSKKLASVAHNVICEKSTNSADKNEEEFLLEEYKTKHFKKSINSVEDESYSKEITMIIEKEPPIITSKTGCLNEPKKEVVKLNISNEKVSSENPDEKSSKFFNRPINKNGYSQTIDNEVIDSASAIEIAFEKEDISKIQEAVKKIYADLDVIDVDEKFSEKAFEEPDIQVPPFLESMDQPFNVNDGKDILSENDIEKKMESFEISFSSNCKSLENINHQIIVRDTTNCKKESSVVIEEINTSNLRSDSNSNSSKIKLTSTINSIIKSTSTDDGYDDYDDDDDDDDGFECVNLDQFGPFAAVYDKLKALQEVQKLEIENSRDLETLATERNGTPDNRSDDLKTSDVKINGSADESNSTNVTLQSSHGISTSNNYSSAYASESSSLSSTLSHSSESLNSAKTEENILASVSVDEIHLDNRSLRHGEGEPYYNHLLIKRPENGSKAQGRRLKKTRDALKNYKRKNYLVGSEDGLEEEAKSSQPEKDVKHKSSLLEEIKRRKLHLNCQPKLDFNFK